MGRDREQPARALLPAHAGGPRASARRGEALGRVREHRHRDPRGGQGPPARELGRMIRAGIRRVLWLALRRRDRWEREVEEEIKLHLMLRAEQLVAQGHSPDDAYTEAVRRFGPLTESRTRLMQAAGHREHSMRRTEYLADLLQDLAFAIRALGRQKAWTAVTIVTLALGIGATTAVFSVVSTLLLHPLPYPHADRIVFVS